MKIDLDEVERNLISCLVDEFKACTSEVTCAGAFGCASEEPVGSMALNDFIQDDFFSFDDDENLSSKTFDCLQVSMESLKNSAVDIWFADNVSELDTAFHLLAPTEKKKFLPRCSDRSTVVFLFRPLGSFSTSPQVYYFSLDSSDGMPVQYTGDIEDLINDSNDDFRIVVFPSKVLKERSVVLAQIKSELIQTDQREPCLDRIIDFFDCSKSRFTFFMSPLPGQFGVLKEGMWWDKIASSGRFHLVLCKPELLTSSNHDFSDPVQGAVKNFDKTIEKFYKNSWHHILSEKHNSRFMKDNRLLECLLSEEDEGPVGAIRQIRIPSLLKFNENKVGSGNLYSGSVKLSFLKYRLACEELALSCLASDRFGENPFLDIDTSDLFERLLSESKMFKTARPQMGRYKWLSTFENYLFHRLICDAVQNFVKNVFFLLNQCMEKIYYEKCREIVFFREMVRMSELQGCLEEVCLSLQNRLEKIESVFSKFADFFIESDKLNVTKEVRVVTSENVLEKLIAELSLPEVQKLFLTDSSFSEEVNSYLRLICSLSYDDMDYRSVENLRKLILKKTTSQSSYTKSVGEVIDSIKNGSLKEYARPSRKSFKKTNLHFDPWEKLQQALDSGSVVKGTVTGSCRGGYDIFVFGLEAFLPYNEIERFSFDHDTFVGQTLDFYPIKVVKERNLITLSNKGLALPKSDTKTQMKDRTAELAGLNLHPDAWECMRFLCRESNFLYERLVESLL